MATAAEAAMIAGLLEQDWTGHTSEYVARQVIDALRKSDKAKADKEAAKQLALFKPFKSTPEVGTAFKTPWSDMTYVVAWVGHELPNDPEMMWVVSMASNFGFVGLTRSPLMKVYKDAAMAQSTIDKLLAPPNVGLSVGDALLFRQDMHFTIEAMFSRGALLRHEATGLLYPEEKENLPKFYRKRVGR